MGTAYLALSWCTKLSLLILYFTTIFAPSERGNVNYSPPLKNLLKTNNSRPHQMQSERILLSLIIAVLGLVTLHLYLQIRRLIERVQQLSGQIDSVHNSKPVLILPQEHNIRDHRQYRPISSISDDLFIHSRTNTNNSEREWMNSIWDSRQVDPDAETVIMSESEVEFVTLAVEYQDSTISITCDDELYEYSCRIIPSC